ncbi:MAG: PilN domain-containing protein [Candidatus Binatia bacterium]
MIRINLLPVQEIEESSSSRKELWLAGGGLLATLVAVFLAYSFQHAHLNAVNSELAQQQSATVKIRKQYKDFEQLEQKKKDLENKLQVVRQLTHPERRTASVHLLANLSSCTPDNLWLTEFSELKGATKIHGFAIDNQAIAVFARNLSNSHYFQNIELRQTTQEVKTADPRKRAGTGKTEALDSLPTVSLTKFLVEAQINYPGEE